MRETALTVKQEVGYPGQVRQAETDLEVIGLWLAGRPEATARAYAFEVKGLLGVIGKNLVSVTLGDLQRYFFGLAHLAPASRSRAVNAAKSLWSFAQRIGYVQFNPAAALISPKVKNCLAERILPEAQVHALIALEPSPRNRVLLRLLYAAGLRVSEICALAWKDMQTRDEAGQVTVYGKGGKTRHVLLSVDTWKELSSIRGAAGPDSPVFPSRKGAGHLHPSQAWRIVKSAVARAGIDAGVSPHWLRHAHASHALDRGAPIHLVQATLGHASVATTGKYLHARPGDSSARYLGV